MCEKHFQQLVADIDGNRFGMYGRCGRDDEEYSQRGEGTANSWLRGGRYLGLMKRVNWHDLPSPFSVVVVLFLFSS